jgi:hypothetical protein
MEQVWIQAGGSKALAPLMAAIGEAESGGWAGATNPTDNGGTQTSWGVWQISNGTHSSPAPGGQNVYDPLVNARLAVQKYQSQGLGAWGTYTSGAYQQFLRGSVPPSTGKIPGGTGGSGGSSGGATQTSSVFSAGLGLGTSIVGDVLGFAKIPVSILSGGIKGATDFFNVIGAALSMVAKFFEGLLWLLNPANWLRMIAGFFGTILLFIALYLLATT